MEIAKHPVFIDGYAFLAEILPFKCNNFPVFSVLNTEIGEVIDYSIGGKSGITGGFNR
jgi:hypothetical protein